MLFVKFVNNLLSIWMFKKLYRRRITFIYDVSHTPKPMVIWHLPDTMRLERVTSSSFSLECSHGFILLIPSPFPCSIVHFKVCINQHFFHIAISFIHYLLVFTKSNCDNISLLWTWVFWNKQHISFVVRAQIFTLSQLDLNWVWISISIAQQADPNKNHTSPCGILSANLPQQVWGIQLCLPLAPAMKPSIRAFSGRVTLLDWRNISCAASICSLCTKQNTVEIMLKTSIQKWKKKMISLTKY